MTKIYVYMELDMGIYLNNVIAVCKWVSPSEVKMSRVCPHSVTTILLRVLHTDNGESHARGPAGALNVTTGFLSEAILN